MLVHGIPGPIISVAVGAVSLPRARLLNPLSLMAWQRITELDTPFAKNGRKYRVVIEGEAREDGTWGGRVVFVDGGESRATGQETSQPSRETVEYWGTGLEIIYLEGAFARAKERR